MVVPPFPTGDHTNSSSGSSTTTTTAAASLYTTHTTMTTPQHLHDQLKKKRVAVSECNAKKQRQRKLKLLKELEDSFLVQFQDVFHEDRDGTNGIPVPPAVPKQRKKEYKPRKRKGIVMYQDHVTLEMKELPPTMSLWYNYYCKGLDHGMELMPLFEEKFRLRFRLPYACYQELAQLCEEESITNEESSMKRWRPGNKAANGKPAAPLGLLLLCALRYLGRGWTFDDLEECTAISQEVIRNFFHSFVEFGSDKLFKMWVYTPRTPEEIASVTSEYSAAGFPGCIGSMDATHVEHCRIAYDYRQAHLSFKLPFTARTYNIVTNHRRRILGTTDGHPARWNDKSLVKFDEIAMDLHEGKGVMKDLEFELYAYGETTAAVKKEKYRGAWILVDNGYLNWGVTIPPMKNTSTKAQWRFSKWLESMRKDVECTFGIMKGRWRILKTGIRLHGTNKSDEIWKTCCALHNWLLEVDGLDRRWGSDWQGGMGDVHEDELPPSVRTLLARNSLVVNYDGSGMGTGDDRQRGEDNAVGELDNKDTFVGSIQEIDGSIVVRKLSMHQFRQRLICHFDIAFRKKELQWPKARLGDLEEPAV